MNKPKIICHMIASVDGKLYPSRWSAGAVKSDISASYERAASVYGAQGWMVGRVTMAEYADSIKEEEPLVTPEIVAGFKGPGPASFTGDLDGRLLAAVFDSRCSLHYSDPILPTGEHLVAVLPACAPQEYLEELQKAGIYYVFAGADGRDLKAGVQALAAAFDASTLLLEGGAVINGAFLLHRLIDELSLLIYPGLDGHLDVPSFLGVKGAHDLSPAQLSGVRMKLISANAGEGDIVWLRYGLTYL